MLLLLAQLLEAVLLCIKRVLTLGFCSVCQAVCSIA